MTDSNRPPIPPIKRIKRSAEESQQKRVIHIPPPSPRYSDTTASTRAPVPPIRRLTGSTTLALTQAKPRGQVTILGEDTRTGEQIAVDDVSRCSGCYIIGTQGVGKSSLLESLIYQDIAKGYAVIVLDPHGQLIDNIISRMPESQLPRTYLLDITDRAYPFGLNIFACRDIEDEDEREATLNRAKTTFEKLFLEATGKQFSLLLRHVAEVLIEHPEMTLYDLPRLLTDETYRREKTKDLRHLGSRNYWQRTYSTKQSQQTENKPFMNRADELTHNSYIRNSLCQRQNTIDFRQAIENREILLIKLPTEIDTYSFAAPIIGTIILSLIYSATFSFQDTPEARRSGFSLYIDEFQHFATKDTAGLFTGGRKYKVRQTLAHQTRTQLTLKEVASATLTANTTVAFRLELDDAPDLARKFTDIDLYPGVQHIYADVLPRLKHHRNAAVTDFWSSYVRKWQEADEKTIKQKTETDYYGNYTREIWPERDLGHGNTAYRPEWVRAALDQLERLFLDAQRRQRVNEAYRAELIGQVSVFLKFGNYLIDCIQSGEENLSHPEKPWYDIFTSSLDAALAALIKDPIGERRETDKGEIADYLTDLDNRHALIKCAGQPAYAIKTLPLVSGVSSTETKKRMKTIQEQTRAKYCRSREEVEAELDNIDEDDQETPSEQNDTLEKLALSHPHLALTQMRMDIEKLIDPLYEKSAPSNAKSANPGLTAMVHRLRKQDILDSSLTATLLKIIPVANRAIHNEAIIEHEQVLPLIRPYHEAIAALTRLQTDTVNSAWDRFEPLE